MTRNVRLAAPWIGDRSPASRDYWRTWTIAVVSTVALWVERGRSRRVLATLGDHQLRDIGLSRADACVESAKPFWQP